MIANIPTTEHAMTNELQTKCLATYMASLSLKNAREEAIAEIRKLASEKIAEVIEEGELTDLDEIVQEVTELIEPECDEILVRDEDRQVVEKIIEAAMDKFLANSDLGGADGNTGDRIVGLIWEHMEEVAKDWGLYAHTSLEAVIDDLIEEATLRADAEIDAILAGTYEDEDDRP
ncbi:hypothetical protein SQW19_05560 [Stenotrophomonas acidaminiphila]|uniref:hypothetical protein n=1 Tax=Stenotrophomonas acidaminiphila TaxID=128780 RepID=UPI002ABE5B84|nr:hypothetical protein [Stenotrophomonas acidaminiphila]WPU57057.1 hypothetical protein SQW19_05560 [Stenotrophomonas acidaminiphila]